MDRKCSSTAIYPIRQPVLAKLSSIAATSVNAADWKVRLGEYEHTKFPLVPGRDFSGTLSVVGEGVKDIALGDAVFGFVRPARRGNAFRCESRGKRESLRL